MTLELTIRFDYGHIVPWVRQIDDALVAVAGPDALCLWSPVPTRGEGMTTMASFTVDAGQRIPFVLTWFPSHQPTPDPIDAEVALDDAEGFWLDWSGTCVNDGDYHEEIRESLLVLKAMTFQPTGGIVAAPTTSLPEEPGGERNWDYRYCWLRDATLTLLAMLRAGANDEAVNWRGWLLRAVAGDPADLQIMYGLSGERRLDERILEWLPGYEGSTPVRVGNAASEQLQLDVYGDVIDALYQTRRQGAPADDNVWSLTRKLLEWLEDGWKLPDHGIWEVRGPARHFTHSKVMAWVAFDRAVRATEEWGRDGPVERWRAIRDEIHAQVIERSWSEHHQAFAQSYGSDELDASVLLMAPVGFMPAADPRFVSTVAAVERELVSGGLVMRYRTRADGAIDGITSDEAAFLPCSFWLADALALIGEVRPGTRAVRAAAGPAQRTGAALGGVRPRREPAAGELPPGVHASRADQHGVRPARRPAAPRPRVTGGSPSRRGSAGSFDLYVVADDPHDDLGGAVVGPPLRAPLLHPHPGETGDGRAGDRGADEGLHRPEGRGDPRLQFAEVGLDLPPGLLDLLHLAICCFAHWTSSFTVACVCSTPPADRIAARPARNRIAPPMMNTPATINRDAHAGSTMSNAAAPEAARYPSAYSANTPPATSNPIACARTAMASVASIFASSTS